MRLDDAVEGEGAVMEEPIIPITLCLAYFREFFIRQLLILVTERSISQSWLVTIEYRTWRGETDQSSSGVKHFRICIGEYMSCSIHVVEYI